MQKKNGDIAGIEILVLIIDTAIKIPTKYAPPSPKKILALGKLNNKNENKTTIWAIRTKFSSLFAWFKLIKRRAKLITNKWIPKSPLKPSIKLAPLIINKKQNKIKIPWNILLESQIFKKIKSTLFKVIEKDIIKIDKILIIKINLIFGLILILASSKKPKRKKEKLIKK